MKQYELQPSPSTLGYPSPEFDKGAFDAAIVQKGYKIYQERAVACPCGDPGHANPSCPHCGGIGYFYINPSETKAIITSINVNTQYKEWTMDNAGTIAVTTYDEGLNLSFFDRITFKEKFGRFTENRVVRKTADKTFVWLTFKPIEIYGVYVIDGGAVRQLSPSDYKMEPSINDCALFLSSIYSENLIVSVYYKHYVQYNVIDLPHEIRASNITNNDGNLRKIDLPVQAIARRANFVYGENNKVE